MSAFQSLTAGNSTPESRARAQRLVRAMVGRTLGFFEERDTANLKHLRGHLLDLADGKLTVIQGQNLRAASVLLDRQPERFLKSYRHQLQLALQEEVATIWPALTQLSAPPKPAADTLEGMSFSLIDLDEVHRILLLDRVAQRFNLHFEPLLTTLSTQLAALMGEESASLSQNPFRPLVLLKGFMLGWEKGELDPQVTEHLVDALEPAHFVDLGPLYTELIATLTQAGVHATTVHRIRKSPNGSSQFAPLSIPADPALLQYLSAMQAGTGRGSRYQFLESDDAMETAGSPHNVLRRLGDQPAFQQAQDLDRGTVNALAEVFDYVFTDGAIPAELKVVIGRLQIPVLRAAMVDRDFFLSAEHPARKLVDTLASASVAWTPDKGEQDPLYQRIESTVQRVLHEFNDDLTLFAALLADFTEFLFESERQADQHIEPFTSRENDEEQLAAALAQADEAVHARVSALPQHLPLAPFLKPFLTTQWRQVIAVAWMTEDTHAGHWNRTLATMDQLIWSTQPKTKPEERQELVGVLPELVRTLNSELDSIGWDGEDRANFTRRLIATHMLAIRMKAAPPLDTQGAALEAHAADEAMQALDERRAGKLAEQDAEQMDDFDASAQLLTRGVWFEKVPPETPPFRCRLSWVSPMRTRFLFTNREGFDAFVLSEREVAAMLRRHELQMLDQAPIVERALNRLMADNAPELRLQA